MFCNQCGNEIPAGVSFCPNCGAPAEQPQQPQQPQYQEPQYWLGPLIQTVMRYKKLVRRHCKAQATDCRSWRYPTASSFLELLALSLPA